LVSASEVEHKAAGRLEHAADGFSESQQPFDMGPLIFVAVFLLALERERRGGDDEVDGVGRAQRQQVERVADMSFAPWRV
jgi:hypothetical protein